MSATTNYQELLGVWDVSIRTPIGSIAVVYIFADDEHGPVGIAATDDEQVSLLDLATNRAPAGLHVTWCQTVTRPIRLRLAFDVVVTDGALDGHSRAGRLPRSTVRGQRRPADRVR